MACTSNINWSTFTLNTCNSTPWAILNEGKQLVYIIGDSVTCGGICDEVQTGNANATIEVGTENVFLTLYLEGIVGTQIQGSDRLLVFLNDELVISGSSPGGNYGCVNSSMSLEFFRRQPYLLPANTEHTVEVSFSTIGSDYHSGCYFSLSAITECVEVSATPTPTVTATPKPCRGANCWCGKDCPCVGQDCESPTPTPTVTPTPSITPSNTNTPTVTPTSTVTPSQCYGCTLWDVNITQGDLNESPDGKVYVDYIACNQTGTTRVSYSYAGLYPEAICVDVCYSPTICIGYNPSCISPVSGSSLTNTLRSCKIVDPNCNEIFTLNITQPGYVEFFDLVNLNQNFGNVEVTISSTNFNDITEIFVGNLENKYGDTFIFGRGQDTQTKTVGFLTSRNKTFLDISIYSEGSLQSPFQPMNITFSAACPTTIPCVPPSATPTSSVTPTNTVTPTPTKTSVTPTPTPTATITPSVTEPFCCYQYEITNYYNTTQTLFYTLCDGTPTSINVAGNGEGVTLCARKNSVTFGGNICDGIFTDCVIITRASLSCNGCEITPTPTPTPTKTSVTPTPTPTITPTPGCFFSASFTEFFPQGIPGQPAPCSAGMDVVFSIDYTGSMGPAIEGVKDSVAQIANVIKTESNNNYRLGLVTFDERFNTLTPTYYTNPNYVALPKSQKYLNIGTNDVNQWITSWVMMETNNLTNFTTQLEKLNGEIPLGSGYGEAEPSDLSVDLIGNNGFAGTFRNNVSKLLILITDNPPGGTNDVYNQEDITYVTSLITPLYNQNIRVLLMTTYPYNALYALAQSTNGSVTSGFTANDIIVAIQNICP
jgi:hypothetical protein